MTRRLATFVALLAACCALSAAPADAATTGDHYDLLVSLAAQGRASCADVRWAAGAGLVEPVEVRWLNDAGVHCPDSSAGREGAPSDQYVVMLALKAKGQLACEDVEWNAKVGYLTWTAVISLLEPGCRLTSYARLVALTWSGMVTCQDVAWHAERGFVNANQAAWLTVANGC